MEVKPLKSYKTPAYPEKYVVLRNPTILKSIPQRWKGNAKIGLALSSIIMLMLTGCRDRINESGEPMPRNDGDERLPVTQTTDIVRAIPIVTPIFEHGDGRGSFGCVSVAPPAFLSEAEAYEVISEEAKREGIIFEKDNLELKKVNLPITSLMYDPKDDHSIKLKSEKGSLKLDGHDNNKKIAFEYISKADVVEWQDKNPGVYSSVESYDALGTAERLKEGLEDRTEGNTVALFYDPMGFDEDVHNKYNEKFRKISDNKELSEDERNAKWSETFQKYEDELKEIKTAQLREQVKDFLDWLKAQRII